MKIDLVWGNSVCVRHEFVRTISPHVHSTLISTSDLLNLNYIPFLGDPKLIDSTRKMLKRQFGVTYKNIALTNGASGAVAITLRAYSLIGYETCLTHEPPFFSLYPDLIRTSGLTHHYGVPPNCLIKPVNLIDNPSNPTGEWRFPIPSEFMMPVIWDAVYCSNVYGSIMMPIRHDVLVGSYGKLTGLNGIRIGWIATNDDLLFETIKPIVAADYGGLSTPSMVILNQVLPTLDWDLFETRAQRSLDENRYQWAKLEKYFGGQTVRSNGMFFWSAMDKQAKQLFEKADILWTPGSALGHNDDFGRFNIGQSNSIIQNAVAKVLKADKIP